MKKLVGWMKAQPHGVILCADAGADLPFSIFAILSDRMWRKLPKDHPTVYPVGNAADALQPPEQRLKWFQA